MVVGIYPAALMVLSLGLAVLIATNKTYQYTFGVMLSYLADQIRRLPHFDHIGIHISFDGIAGLFESVNNFILHKLGEGINALEKLVLDVWQNMVATIIALGDVIAEVAENTEKTIGAVVSSTIPRLVHAGTHWIVGSLQGILRRLTALEHAAGHIAHVVTHYVTHEVTKVVGKTTAITKYVYVKVPAAITKAVAIPWGAIHGLERAETALGKRVKSLEKVAGVAAVGVVASVVLGKLGLGWTRCSKVGRLGRAACGFPESLIEDLIAGAVIVASSISVIELAKECRSFTGDVDDALRLFVRELR